MNAKFFARMRLLFSDFPLMLIPAWRRDIETTERYCDIGHEIHVWVMDPNLPPPCWSEGGRALVRSYIIAYLDFLDAHRFLKRDNDYLEMLLRWLIPFPYHPPPVPKRKRIPSRLQRDGSFVGCLFVLQ